MPILNDPKVREKLEKLPLENAQKVREEFLKTYAKTEPKHRRGLKESFVLDPTRPVIDIAREVERERTLQVVVAFKAPPELVDRIEQHKRASGTDAWNRSEAVKDLVERGLKSVGL